MNTTIYRDIAARTGGNIYIGVVGPVRTGKSTFIKKFMEALVLPNMEDANQRERTRDEMPQSAAGKTVMTAEPKFVPEKAVEITLGDAARMSVRMVDCVGYMVPDALGNTENGSPRMVHTPWQEDPMPFAEAAETGTRKVIGEHSTVGIVVTTDGTIGEIPRNNYVEAEKRVIQELKELRKPFGVIVNSADPSREESIRLATALEKEYDVPVALVNCLELSTEDIRHILNMILLEFPVREIAVEIPGWVSALDASHPIVTSLREAVLSCAEKVTRVGNAASAFDAMKENEWVETASVGAVDLGTGKGNVRITLPETQYYNTLGELTGFRIENEEELILLLRRLSEIKRKYDKVADALDEVQATGYGIVTPDVSELKLDEPTVIRQQSGYGVKLKASGPSIHMIRAEIETEINPIVGSEQQSDELVHSLQNDFRTAPEKLWEYNIFGRTLYTLVNEGLQQRLTNIPDDSRKRLSETLEKVINEGSGGLICIIL